MERLAIRCCRIYYRRRICIFLLISILFLVSFECLPYIVGKQNIHSPETKQNSIVFGLLSNFPFQDANYQEESSWSRILRKKPRYVGAQEYWTVIKRFTDVIEGKTKEKLTDEVRETFLHMSNFITTNANCSKLTDYYQCTKNASVLYVYSDV